MASGGARARHVRHIPGAAASKTEGYAGSMAPISVSKWLAKLNCVFFTAHVKSARQSAHAAFVQNVESWDLPPVNFTCHTGASFRPELQSDEYLRHALTVTAGSGKQWTFSTPECQGASQRAMALIA